MRIKIAVLILAALAILAAAPFIGATEIPWRAVLEDSTAAKIFWEIRLPRVLVAMLVGAGLSLCGLVYQSLFQNVLASPYTLGISSGAAFGATLYLAAFAGSEFWGGSALAGILGAALCVAIVLFLARKRRAGSATLLLCGVVLSFFFSSLILFLQYASDFTKVFRITRWLMGSLEGAALWQIGLLAAVLGIALVVIARRARELDLLACGEEIAISKGVDPTAAERSFVVVTSLIVGVIVSVAGPIGFVGIMVPHTVRLLIGPLHTRLVPATVIVGGAFLVACDTIARTVVAPFEIPVGVITALLGGPFFLALLLSKRGQQQIGNLLS